MADFFALRELGEDRYSTTVEAVHAVGPRMKMGYGGHTLAIGIKAACVTAPPGFHVYSITGQFLGPARNDRKIQASVRRIRDTRTFVTRFVELSQVQDDGTARLCLSLLADFHIQEPESVLTFSMPPAMQYTKYDKCPTANESADALLAKGIISKEQAQRWKGTMGFFDAFYEVRACPETVFSQQLIGLNKIIPSPQDHLSISEKRSADWFKNKTPLHASEQAASLGFMMDACLPIVAHFHAGMAMSDVGQASSLDFALRVFVNDLNLNDWCLREWKAITAGEGRTFAESNVWDERGRMVCSITQQCVLRPRGRPKAVM